MLRILVVTLMLAPGPAAAGAVSVCTTRFGRSCSAAARTSMRRTVNPCPTQLGQAARVSAMGFPETLSAVRSSSTLAVGARSRRTANVPVTCGADIDVPLRAKNMDGGYDDVMFWPGAIRRFGKTVGE